MFRLEEVYVYSETKVYVQSKVYDFIMQYETK